MAASPFQQSPSLRSSLPPLLSYKTVCDFGLPATRFLPLHVFGSLSPLVSALCPVPSLCLSLSPLRGLHFGLSSCGPLLSHSLGPMGSLASLGPSLVLSKDRRGKSGASQSWWGRQVRACDSHGSRKQEETSAGVPGAPGSRVGLHALLTLPPLPSLHCPGLQHLLGSVDSLQSLLSLLGLLIGQPQV